MAEFHSMKEVHIPIINIIMAEMTAFYGYVYFSVGIHTINLLLIIFLIIFNKSEIRIKYALQSIILVILLRIVGLSMPQFFTNTLLQYSLIYGVMFIPIFLLINSQNISTKELGINFRKIYVYLPLAILIGSIMGIIEYNILSPIHIIDKIKFFDVILLGIVMFIFIGTVEEVIFRGILQTRFEKIFGLKLGILISGIIFGIMHASDGIMNEIIFAMIIGVIMGYIFHISRNIPFVISIHGATNVVLYGILPMVIL